MLPLELEPLTEAERDHETRLRGVIGDAIRASGGWLPFDAFMQLALYAPGLGYYAAGAHKLGAGGDFVTAPELSPVFGRCLAEQCAQVLRGLGGGDIVEVGAGTGALAESVLRELHAVGQLPARYRILEISPDLRERQRARLHALPEPLRSTVEWIDTPPVEPYRGLLLANEVIDALPVVRWRGTTSGLTVLGVAWRDGEILEAPRPASEAERARFAEMDIELADRQEIEWCPQLSDWIATITASLTAGVALFIDYGDSRRRLYSVERPQGTLVAFHRHRMHNNPYINLGVQDLTAWVDFTAVAEAGLAAGLEVAGYTTQACFLLGCGFDRHLARWLEELPVDEAPLAARKALRLVLPNDMGERFKCLALARAYPDALSGFSIRDFTATL
jgi:SAM-dependent MidA family methyltransferase